MNSRVAHIDIILGRAALQCQMVHAEKLDTTSYNRTSRRVAVAGTGMLPAFRPLHTMERTDEAKATRHDNMLAF
jgi:hypothetical protein